MMITMARVSPMIDAKSILRGVSELETSSWSFFFEIFRRGLEVVFVVVVFFDCVCLAVIF